MNGTPDVFAALPVLRFFYLEPGLYGEPSLRSSNSGHVWSPDEQHARCDEAMAHLSPNQLAAAQLKDRTDAEADEDEMLDALHGLLPGHTGPPMSWFVAMWGSNHKPNKHNLDDAPQVECSCGFYGWYPWIRDSASYYPYATAAPSERELVHPAVKEAIVWCNSNHASPATYRRQVIIGVIDIWGTTVLHDSGVRAQHARLRALVSPQLEPYLVVNSAEQHASARLRLAQCRLSTGKIAEEFGVPVISAASALGLSSEWDAIRDRIMGSDLGGGLR